MDSSSPPPRLIFFLPLFLILLPFLSNERIGLRVDKFGLRFLYDTSEDGHVRVYLRPDEDGDEPNLHYNYYDRETGTTAGSPSSAQHVTVFSSPVLRHIPEVQGWSRFSLIAELSCKRGACVFNHSQLFLQQRTAGLFEKEMKKYPFRVDISLAWFGRMRTRPVLNDFYLRPLPQLFYTYVFLKNPKWKTKNCCRTLRTCISSYHIINVFCCIDSPPPPFFIRTSSRCDEWSLERCTVQWPWCSALRARHKWSFHTIEWF